MTKPTDNRWAIGVVVAFGLFGVGLCVMVVASMTKSVDLVTDNYYEKGLRYEQQIQAVKRTEALAEQVGVATGINVLALSFPDRFFPATVKGEILLYRPSDRRLDVVVPVQLDSVGQQRIPTGSLERGLWKVQLSWTYQGVNYYSEQSMILQ